MIVSILVHTDQCENIENTLSDAQAVMGAMCPHYYSHRTYVTGTAKMSSANATRCNLYLTTTCKQTI